MENMSDQLVRAISKDGFVKAAAVSTRALTERARQIHQTSPVATAALGRLLAAGSMMGNELKGDGSSVTLRIKGDGPLGTLLVVADNEGNVRGSVQNPQIDLPIREDGKLDVGGAVGHGGTLTVIKDLNDHHRMDLVATFMGAHLVPAEYKSNREEYVRLVCEEMMPKVKEQGIAKFCDVFCEADTFTVEESRQVLEAGLKYGLRPKIHADEIEATIPDLYEPIDNTPSRVRQTVAQGLLGRG